MDKGLFESDAFLSLNPAAQTKVAREHFKETLATADTYKSLDQEQRNSVYNNYLKEVLPQPKPKGVIDTVIDNVKEFGAKLSTAYKEDQAEQRRTHTSAYQHRYDVAGGEERARDDKAKEYIASNAEKMKERKARIEFVQKPALQQFQEEILDAPMRAAQASAAGIASIPALLIGGEKTAKVVSEAVDTPDDFTKAFPETAMAQTILLDPLNAIDAPVKIAMEGAKAVSKGNKLHDAAQGIIDSTADSLGIDLPKPKATPETITKDEAIAKAIADEQGAPEIDTAKEVVADINVGRKNEEIPHTNPPVDAAPIIDTEAKIKAAQEEQAARVEKALEEGRARKLELEAQSAPKPLIEDLQAHPRYDELLEMRRNVTAKSAENKAVREGDRTILHQNNGEGYETSVIPANDVRNYDYDFELTRGDVMKIEKGKITPEIEAKLQKDLERLDSDPLYAKIETTPLRDTQVAKAAKVFGEDMAEANMKVIDEIAKAKGMSTDEWLKSTGYDLEDMRHTTYPQFKADMEEADALFQPAYHGTPHNVDKFTTEKIGTGEGAQAYGYGLYFAGDKKVAEFYRNKLAPSNTANDLNTQVAYIKLGEKSLSEFDIDPYDIPKFAGSGDTQGFREYAKKKADDWNALAHDETYQFPKYAQEKANAWNDVLNTKGELVDTSKGNLYKVDLKPEEDELLIWGKPLRNQSNNVQNIIPEIRVKLGDDFVEMIEDKLNLDLEDMSGYELHGVLKKYAEETPLIDGSHSNIAKDVADYLHSLGIRGIKYEDGMSRGTATPNYNYVIFHNDDVEIIGHNYKMLNGQGDELFQDEKFVNGMVSIGINSKGEMQSTIRLFESADFSTLIHESAHVVESQFDEIERAAYNKAFAHVAEGKARQEAFAEAFVKYLSEGISPTDELVGAFEKFKNWLVDLWKVFSTRESEFKLTDEHIDFMRAIMGNKEAAGRVFGDVKPSKVMNSKGDELLQTQQKSAGGFYSAAQRAIEKMPPKMESEAFIKYLKNNGVKDDEILYSGIAKVVEGKASITKAEIEGAFANPVMEKTVLQGNDSAHISLMENRMREAFIRGDDAEANRIKELLDQENVPAKYENYSLKGVGANYREELTKYSSEDDFKNWVEKYRHEDDPTWEDIKNDPAMYAQYQKVFLEEAPTKYRSSHWDEPNVLLHTRKQDTIIDGDKTLLVEEIQSDWHQDGRKQGYKYGDESEIINQKNIEVEAIELDFEARKIELGLEENKYEARQLWSKEFRPKIDGIVDKYAEALKSATSGIPNAPMSKTWHEFGMRQLIDEAVTKGYDRVAWVDGATHANRYSMSHSVDRLVYNKHYHVIEGYKEGKSVMYKNADESELEALIGKEPAKRLMENEVHSGIHEIKGEALDIGGDGMKGFYDKILVDYAKKYTKKWGVSVEKKTLPNGVEVHSFPVNAKMKEDIAKNGQPLYVQGGGMLAGVGEDENGNVTFDPIMALAGIAGVSTLMSKSVRGAVSKLAGKAEHLSDATIQGMVRVAIKGVDKVTANSITKVAEKISKSDLVDYVIGHKIYKLDDYMKLREGALRSANAGMEHAARLHLQLVELSSEAREAMYAYMSGDKTVALTPELKRAADTFITKIDGMGQEMVDEGFLTKEAYEEWKGQYLHRKYASKIKQASDWASGKGEFSVEKIHMRGKTWNASEEEYQGLLKAGEIGKVSEGKIEVLKDTDGGYKLRRDWTAQERKEMGEIRDAAYSLPETVGRLVQMIEFGKMLKGVPAKYLMEQGQYSDAVMKQLGYEKLSGSRYGALNGKWVNHSIAGDLKRVSNDVMGEEGNVKRLWNDYVSAVKMSHTIYNPTAHVNNIGSNVFLQAAGGLNPFKTIKYATDGTIAARRYGRCKELSAKVVSGLDGDEAAELSKLEADSDVVLYKELDEKKMFGRSQLNEMLRSYMSPSIDTTTGSMAHKVSESMKALYQGEDDVMRFSAVKQLMNDGVWADGKQRVMSIDEAMKHVNDTIVPDYSKPMSKLALTLRDSGLVPFMSWTYYSTPILLKQLRTHPSRVAMIAGGWYGLDLLFGVDPYDDETMPKGFDAQRVAVGREGDKVTGLRVSSMVPHIQLAQPANTFLEPLTSGIPQTMLGAATNYNFYFRKPITMKEGGEGAYHRVKDAVQNVLPSPDVIDKAYNLAESKLLDKETRRRDRVFEPRTPAQEAASFFVNLQTYDVSQQRDRVRKDKVKSIKRDEKWGKKVDNAMTKLEKVFQ